MYKYISSFWINVGILLFLATTDVQAITLTYHGVDTQNKTLISEIKVTEQIDNLFFLRITGGMPSLDTVTQKNYLRALNSTVDYRGSTPVQAVAIFSAPFLYVIAPGSATSYLKEIVDVTHTYVFVLQDEKHLRLSHYFIEGDFCMPRMPQPDTDPSKEDDIFYHTFLCQPLAMKTSFDGSVIYDINQ